MPHKVLIVDDEKDIVLVLKTALSKRGYLVSEAYDGMEALEQVARVKPDIILLDIMMPVLDGYAVNFKLKENPETAGIPVIVITGKGNIKELMKIRDSLMVAAYIEKPFTVTLLLDKIKEILHE